MSSPLFDPHVIAERQSVWKDMHELTGLREQLQAVKVTADRAKYERYYQRTFNNMAVQELENGRLLVDFVDSVESVSPSVRSNPIRTSVRGSRTSTSPP